MLCHKYVRHWRICICNCYNGGVGGPPRLTPDNCGRSSAIGSTDSRPGGDNAERSLDKLKCILDRRARGTPPIVRPKIRRTPPPCRIAEGSSRNKINSRGPVRCTGDRCPAKSSLTRFDSPPGNPAHTGHTTSKLVSVCSADTCSNKLASLKHVFLQYGQWENGQRLII
uniref:Uncharacterized protein n=1 Tax=Glossina pallidipes TaxID=7398 RepID=A0A1A9ZLM3_GLOPL